MSADAGIRLGVRWPDFEVPLDKVTVRDFVQGAEELGFDHITAFDHLVGLSDPSVVRGPALNNKMSWHETFSLFSHMAAISDRLGFLTASLVLPQRPTLLVAKQAASLDLLCGGRLRLGIGVGRNHVEYGIMGADFHTRGARAAEQMQLLRALWTEDEVAFDGKWHHIPPTVSLCPLPVQRPIPIWMGMGFDPPDSVIRRAGQFADGLLHPWPPGDDARRRLERVFDEAREVGRDPSSIGLEPPVNLRVGTTEGIGLAPRKSDETIAWEIREWADIGVSHLELKTQHCGLATLDEHLAEMARFQEVARASTTIAVDLPKVSATLEEKGKA